MFDRINIFDTTPVVNSSYMVSFDQLLDYYDYTVRMKYLLEICLPSSGSVSKLKQLFVHV